MCYFVSNETLKHKPSNHRRRFTMKTGDAHTFHSPPMKWKRTNSLESSTENFASAKLTGSPMKRKNITPSQETYSYLPDECWKCIFKLMNDYNRHNLDSLSLVSKQLLSITNRLRFSLTIKTTTRPFLPRLLKRFTNLTSLDLSHYGYELDELLRKIYNFPLKLTSLKLPKGRAFPANGLRAFSQTITTLTSLTCCSHVFGDNNDLSLVADCFPLLKELNLGHPQFNNHTNFINGFHSLLSNCQYIQHLDLNHTYFLNDQDVAEFSLFLAALVSINLNGCWRLTESSLFSLVTNCPSLSDIKMECTTIGKESIEYYNSMTDFAVSPQLKSLSLADYQHLRDENIVLFPFMFPVASFFGGHGYLVSF